MAFGLRGSWLDPTAEASRRAGGEAGLFSKLEENRPKYGDLGERGQDEADRLGAQGAEVNNYYANRGKRLDINGFQAQSRTAPGYTRSDGLSMAQSKLAAQGALNRLRSFYQNGPGPSAAVGQLYSGMGAAQNQNVALSQAQRGMGPSLAAQKMAGNQNASLYQQTNQQADVVRAQEEAAWRQRQLQAMGLEQDQLHTLRGQDVQDAQFRAEAEAKQRAMNDKYTTGYEQLALGNRQLGSDSQLNDEKMRQGIFQGQLAAQSGMQGALANQAIGNAQADQLRQAAWIGAGATGGAAAVNLFKGSGGQQQQQGNGIVDPWAHSYGGEDPNDPWANSDEHSKRELAETKGALAEALGRLQELQSGSHHPGGANVSAPAPQNDLRPAQGYQYEYRPGYGPEGKQYGPMAQDLEKTPAGASVVRTGPNGMKQVDTSRLSLVNTGAISEQQNRQDDLDARLKRLESYTLAGSDSMSRGITPNYLDDSVKVAKRDIEKKKRTTEKATAGRRAMPRRASGEVPLPPSEAAGEDRNIDTYLENIGPVREGNDPALIRDAEDWYLRHNPGVSRAAPEVLKDMINYDRFGNLRRKKKLTTEDAAHAQSEVYL